MTDLPSPNPSPQRFRAALIIFDNLEELIAVLLLFLIGLVIALQVFMRTVLSAPLSWPEELSQFLFVWASVLGAVGAGKRFGLVRFESIVERLPKSARSVLDYVVLAAVFVLLSVLGWQGWRMANRTTYAATTLPITWWWMHTAASAFAVLMLVRLVQVQVFKYRFTFVESVLSKATAGSGTGGTP